MEEEKPNWLPEYEVNFTALELGFLMAVVSDAINDVPVNVPDENKLPVPSTIKEAILGKLNKATEQFYREVN